MATKARTIRAQNFVGDLLRVEHVVAGSITGDTITYTTIEGDTIQGDTVIATELSGAGANAGDFYIADGAGGADWGPLPPSGALFQDGSAVTPGVEFASGGAGMFRAGTDEINLAANGVEVLSLRSATTNNVVLGPGNSTASSNTVLIGADSSSAGFRSVVIGKDASGTADSAVAIGRTATAAGSAVAIGRDATASGESSVALGHVSSATGIDSIAIRGTASAASTVAVGVASEATATDATACGERAQATAAGATALGSNTVANVVDGFFVRHANTSAVASSTQRLAVFDSNHLLENTELSAAHVVGASSQTLGSTSFTLVAGSDSYAGNPPGTAFADRVIGGTALSFLARQTAFGVTFNLGMVIAHDSHYVIGWDFEVNGNDAYWKTWRTAPSAAYAGVVTFGPSTTANGHGGSVVNVTAESPPSGWVSLLIQDTGVPPRLRFNLNVPGTAGATNAAWKCVVFIPRGGFF